MTIVDLVDDQVDDGVSKRRRDVNLHGVVVKLVARPEDVDLVQRPVHPVVDELYQKEGEEPSADAVPGQVHYAVVVVEKVEEGHDDAQQGDAGGDEDEAGADVDDNVGEAAEALALRKADRLLDEHQQAEDGEDLERKKEV